MNLDELNEVVMKCPTLYHMAERGSWESIKERGLLSTTALLDLYGVEGSKREEIEQEHRSTCVSITASSLPDAVIRDQIPMSDSGLVKALPPRLKPSDWYKLLNSKVFFWLTEERLHKLSCAKAYRDLEHDILEVDTRSMIESHRDRIWFCPFNSGCTKPFPHKRDEGIFARIENYDYATRRSKYPAQNSVVEFCVDYSVPDIKNHVKQVVVKKGTEIIKVLE